MALFRPTPKPTEGGRDKFTGICEVGLVNVKDRSSEFDWADIYLELELALKDSKYTRTLQLAGGLEKDASGNIVKATVLDRIYRIFDAIGCAAGVTIKGDWETHDGQPIQDIAAYLNTNHLSSFMPDAPPAFDYVAYIYKKRNKKTGKTFNDVLTKLYPNTEKGKADMASYVKWMKQNGYLNEVTDSDSDTPTGTNVAVSADAL
jgi:hypothetical protein